MAKHKKIDLSNLLELRKAHRENQEVFWRRFGVTQSGGSRYESGGNIPTPIALLLGLWASGTIGEEELAQARKAVNRPMRINVVEFFK